MLKVDELHVNYGEARVLHGVSLEVKQGELVALIGPNGAGKTTLLRCISGLKDISAGDISFNGGSLRNCSTEKTVKSGLAHIPEGRRIFHNMTVLENLLLGGILIDRGERKKDLENVFALFPRLAERKEQTSGTLSGGEQSMLVIGRALMMRPKMLMMDEPCLGLAPIIVSALAEKIVELSQKGMTVLLVEQNANFALKIASRAYVLSNGKIVTTGNTAELLKREETIRKAYLGA